MSASNASQPEPPKPAAAKTVKGATSSDGSVRETLESILIAFVLAFIFRAFIVEAFVIPTGSMAPTLLGQHVRMNCPQCGYEFTMGPRDYGTTDDGQQVALPLQGAQTIRRNEGSTYTLDPLEAACPMCRFPIVSNVQPTDAGDRILVLKYVYTLDEPTRWDVVVFKNPEEPEVNYIKRLVGLPNEQLLLAGGDVYTRPLESADEGAWRIQSKPDFVQRAVWQPVYHSNHYPLDGGDPAVSPRNLPWRMPWVMRSPPVTERRERPTLTHDPVGPRFTYDSPDGSPASLAFDFSPVDPGLRGGREAIEPNLNYYAYNMTDYRGGLGQGGAPIHDLRLAATVAPRDAGLRLTMALSDFNHVYRVVIMPDGPTMLQRTDRPADPDADLDTLTTWQTLAEAADPVELVVGSGTRVELWHVDGELSVFVEGRRVGFEREGQTVDRYVLGRMPADPPAPARSNWPIVRIGVQGPLTTLRAVDLDRDLYYTDQGMRGVSSTPAYIKSGHYFCLGDNSPQSKDGRLWNTVDPWVRTLAGEDERELMGYVPEDLMIGRAFFVYFPAGFRLRETSPGFVPNFGKMRFIH